MNKTKFIKIVIIAIIWFVVGHILMYTIGAQHVPSGGLDSIANAILYVALWRIFASVIPIIIILISALIWLYTAHPRFIKICFIIIIFGICTYKAAKFIIYTPQYLAENSESYKEVCEQMNNFEKNEETECDRIDYYIEWQTSTVLDKAKIRAKTKEEKYDYIIAFLDYRIKELPNVVSYKYIQDASIIVDTDKKSYEQEEMLLKYTKATNWCENHYYKTRYVDFEKPIIIIYYDDNTVDAINLYENLK